MKVTLYAATVVVLVLLTVPLDFAVAGPDDFDRVFTAMGQERVEALIVHPSVGGRKQVFEFAVQRRLPAIYTLGQRVEEGGLMSYGAHFSDMWRRAVTYVHKILQGTKPGSRALKVVVDAAVYSL